MPFRGDFPFTAPRAQQEHLLGPNIGRSRKGFFSTHRGKRAEVMVT